MENGNGAWAAFGSIIALIYVVVIVIFIISMWKIFTKAGKPGWAAIIPIYNIIVLLEIVKRPIWWIILLLIPLVNIVMSIIVSIDLLKAFEQPVWHIILILFVPFIYMPWLAFSSAKYVY